MLGYGGDKGMAGNGVTIEGRKKTGKKQRKRGGSNSYKVKERCMRPKRVKIGLRAGGWSREELCL